MVANTIVEITINTLGGQRLDKALAANVPTDAHLSRARILELILSGHVFKEAAPITDQKAKVALGEVYEIRNPPVAAMELKAEAIPLDIRYEDDDLIVINKPVGMVVHPAKSVQSGTLVNAILHHARGTLSGIGGVERPGIVHRIDKDTSGLLVVAKNDATHQGLADQFRAHSIERLYRAFVYGALTLADRAVHSTEGVNIAGGQIRIDQPIGRHPHDRLRMAVRADGKAAVTYVQILGHDPTTSVTGIACRLETGRTHQIRVHLSALGFPLLGDPVYARGARSLRADASAELTAALAGLAGQALHAAVLGFVHPRTGAELRFEAELPPAMAALERTVLG